MSSTNPTKDCSYLNHSLALPVHLSAHFHFLKSLGYLQNESLVAVFASEQPTDYRLLTWFHLEELRRPCFLHLDQVVGGYRFQLHRWYFSDFLAPINNNNSILQPICYFGEWILILVFQINKKLWFPTFNFWRSSITLVSRAKHCTNFSSTSCFCLSASSSFSFVSSSKSAASFSDASATRNCSFKSSYKYFRCCRFINLELFSFLFISQNFVRINL